MAEFELAVKNAIDEIYTQYPFFGSRRIKVMLNRRGFKVNRKRVQRYMRKMGLVLPREVKTSSHGVNLFLPKGGHRHGPQANGITGGRCRLEMSPDFEVMERVLRREEPQRIPLYEHFVDYEVAAEIMGWSKLAEDPVEHWKRMIEFYRQMGYDYLPMEIRPNFPVPEGVKGADTALYSRGERSWVNEHGGPIQTWDDLLATSWPELESALDYHLFDEIGALLPPGMKIIGGASGGPFEHASFLMGFERLAVAIHTEPDLVEQLFSRIGQTLVAVAECLACKPYIGAYRYGDDLGFKTATMLSPKHLRQYVFPWQKKVVEAVHRAGKPFVFHSCGQLREVMDDLIEDVKIDAKHSFEDVILPVAEAKRLWGGRIAILGGIDVDFMAQRTAKEVKDYTLKVLEACAPGGGYALGSGNTITNYIPVENYLAMLEAGQQFNGIS